MLLTKAGGKKALILRILADNEDCPYLVYSRHPGPIIFRTSPTRGWPLMSDGVGDGVLFPDSEGPKTPVASDLVEKRKSKEK